MNALMMNEFDEIEEITERERFRLNTIDEVNWAFRKMAALNSKQAEIDDLAAKEMHRITDWKNAESKKLTDNITFFEGLLREYALTQRDNDPQFKKTSTPYGKVMFKKQQPKWIYDDTALLECLKSNGMTDLIRIKEEPNKADLKKRVDFDLESGQIFDPETGLILDGVKVEEQEDAILWEVDVRV